MTESSSDGLILPTGMAEPLVMTWPAGMVVAFSCANPQGSGINEDRAVVVPRADGALVLAVADGAGGAPQGEEASTIAVHSVRSATRQVDGQDLALRGAILDAFEMANGEILALGVGAATTLAVVAIDDSRLRSYHAGDSGILVTGQRGRAKALTVDHSPVGYAVEAGFLDPSDALHHEERHVVSNLVGIADMRIEMGSPLSLAPFDTVVVASDGLFDNLHVAEIVEIVRKGDLQGAAGALVARCLARMRAPDEGQPSKPDDLTFLLFRRHRLREMPRFANG